MWQSSNFFCTLTSHRSAENLKATRIAFTGHRFDPLLSYFKLGKFPINLFYFVKLSILWTIVRIKQIDIQFSSPKNAPPPSPHKSNADRDMRFVVGSSIPKTCVYRTYFLISKGQNPMISTAVGTGAWPSAAVSTPLPCAH